jgi:anti-sigma factor RsiW
MMNSIQHGESIKKYLLGRMSTAERRQFESQYFTDNDLFHELISVEDELIDSYVRGRLSAKEQQEFESRFLTVPERVERVRFAQALVMYASQCQGLTARKEPVVLHRAQPNNAKARGRFRFPRPHASALRWATAFLVLVLLAASAWMAGLNRRLRRELASMRDHQAAMSQQAEQSAQELSNVKAQLREEHSITDQDENQIAQGQTRSDQIGPFVLSSQIRDLSLQRVLILTREIQWAPIQINLERDDHPEYEVFLEDAQGNQLWHQTELKSYLVRSAQHTIRINVPAKILLRGDYALRVVGIAANGKRESVAFFSFPVERR